MVFMLAVRGVALLKRKLNMTEEIEGLLKMFTEESLRKFYLLLIGINVLSHPAHQAALLTEALEVLVCRDEGVKVTLISKE